MKLAFHDLHSQYSSYKSEIDAAIQNVLNSCQFIMGEEVYRFEENLANYIGCPHAISCGSGTDAIFLALMAIGIKPGDEVITTPFTFVATSEVISLLGAKPVFVDIQTDTYNINPNLIEEKITSKTRAILPVSLYGQPSDMNEINEIAEAYSNKISYKIYVIEDAAQSCGAVYQGKKSGSLSDIACLSFFPTKPLGCYGDGGAVLVQDASLSEKIKSLRVHGQTKRYFHEYVGFNCRLDTLQAAVLNVKLNYLSEEILQRQKIAKRYGTLLAKLELNLPIVKGDRTSTYAQYSIRSQRRMEIMEFFKNKNIPINVHYPQPLHLQNCFSYLGYSKGDFPVAEKISQEIFSLPMSAFLNLNQQNYIASALSEAFETNLVS